MFYNETYFGKIFRVGLALMGEPPLVGTLLSLALVVILNILECAVLNKLINQSLTDLGNYLSIKYGIEYERCSVQLSYIMAVSIGTYRNFS